MGIEIILFGLQMTMVCQLYIFVPYITTKTNTRVLQRITIVAPIATYSLEIHERLTT